MLMKILDVISTKDGYQVNPFHKNSNLQFHQAALRLPKNAECKRIVLELYLFSLTFTIFPDVQESPIISAKHRDK